MERNTNPEGAAKTKRQITSWDDVIKSEVGHVFHDEFTKGMRFIILRGPASLCAYVGLPLEHPLSGQSYDDLTVDCHGGLTFSKEGDGKHLPKSYWWYGWDYAHCDDASTYDARYPLNRNGKQWTSEMVKDESFSALYDFERLMKLAEKIKASPVPEAQQSPT